MTGTGKAWSVALIHGVLKIDEAMAEVAVMRGRRIGLVATEEATVGPERVRQMLESLGWQPPRL
ncbi:MAG: hypothetical protein Q8P50_12025 [Bacillota bacterium]|nr:hypothetical protein [Bacillota bacterium]